jgi:hypothetical protein
MEGFGEIYGTMANTRLTRRLSRRQLAEEARIQAEPARPGRERSLSEHIPSSLISLQDRVRALAIGGAPAWSRRLNRIFDLTNAAGERLRAEWQALARSVRGDAPRFAEAWRRHAETVDFSQVNELIARHNQYFPTEANLAMDVKTLDYVAFGGADYRRQPLDAAWVLAQFPPDLDAALVGPSQAESRPSHR